MGDVIGTYSDDFDAFIADTGPVYEFKWQDRTWVVDRIDIEAFAKLADVHQNIDLTDVALMLRTLKELVRDQLRTEDQEAWMESRPPYQMLTRIAERLTEAATGQRPTEGLSGFGELPAPTGQSSNPSSSDPVTLPPPSEG